MLNHFTMEVFPASEENRTQVIDYLRGYQSDMAKKGEQFFTSVGEETLLLAGQDMNATIDQLIKFVHKFMEKFGPEKIVLDYSASILSGNKEITHRASNIEIKTS